MVQVHLPLFFGAGGGVEGRSSRTNRVGGGGGGGGGDGLVVIVIPFKGAAETMLTSVGLLRTDLSNEPKK